MSRLTRAHGGDLRLAGWLALWVVLAAGFRIVFQWMLVEQAEQREGQLSKEVYRLRDEQRACEAVLANLSKFERERTDLDEKLTVLDRLLPPTRDEEGLRALLARIGQAHGFETRHVTAGEAQTMELYATWPLEIEVRGPLSALLRLPDQLAREKRHIETRGVEVAREGAAYRATLRGVTYSEFPRPR